MPIHNYRDDWSKEQQMQWIKDRYKFQRENPLLFCFLENIYDLIGNMDMLIWKTWKKRHEKNDCFMGDCIHLNPDDDDPCKDVEAQSGEWGKCKEFKEQESDS